MSLIHKQQMEKYNFTLTSDSVILTSLPFFKKLTHIDGPILGSGIEPKEPSLYILNCPNGLVKCLNEIYSESDNKIVLDCSLFAQLLIHFETDPMQTVYLFVIGPPINALSLYDSSLRLCYLRSTDADAFKYLQQSSCIAKGQYLVRTSDPNIFMGLGSNGMTAQPLDAWIKEMIDGCIQWSDISAMDDFSVRYSSSNKHSINIPLKGIINIFIKTKRLDSWYIEKDCLMSLDMF